MAAEHGKGAEREGGREACTNTAREWVFLSQYLARDVLLRSLWSSEIRVCTAYRVIIVGGLGWHVATVFTMTVTYQLTSIMQF